MSWLRRLAFRIRHWRKMPTVHRDTGVSVYPVKGGAAIILSLADGRDLTLLLPRASAVSLCDAVMNAIEDPEEKETPDEPTS